MTEILDQSTRVPIVNGVGAFHARRLPRFQLDGIIAATVEAGTMALMMAVARAAITGAEDLRVDAKAGNQPIEYSTDLTSTGKVAAEAVFEALPQDLSSRFETYAKIATIAGLETNVEVEQGKSSSSPDGSGTSEPSSGT
ncbi:MAG: hypothetical protein AAF108_02935 [Planctomycetota bacterium]